MTIDRQECFRMRRKITDLVKQCVTSALRGGVDSTTLETLGVHINHVERIVKMQIGDTKVQFLPSGEFGVTNEYGDRNNVALTEYTYEELQQLYHCLEVRFQPIMRAYEEAARLRAEEYQKSTKRFHKGFLKTLRNNIDG